MSNVSGSIATLGSAAAASMQTLPAALPQVIDTGLSGTQTVVRGVSLAERPIALAARGTRVGFLTRAAGALGRVMPFVAIGASALSAAQVVRGGGYEALLTTREGRSATLGALGGAMLLAPIPPMQLGAALVFAVSAANELGAFTWVDRAAAARTAARDAAAGAAALAPPVQVAAASAAA